MNIVVMKKNLFQNSDYDYQKGMISVKSTSEWPIFHDERIIIRFGNRFQHHNRDRKQNNEGYLAILACNFL